MENMFRHHDPIADALRGLSLPRAAAERLSQRGTLVKIRDGVTLCTEGERGLQAFLILDGTAAVLAKDTVITIGPGDVVGEIATLDQRRTRTATVVAQGDVEALVFDVRTFADLAEDPDLRPRLAPERQAA